MSLVGVWPSSSSASLPQPAAATAAPEVATILKNARRFIPVGPGPLSPGSLMARSADSFGIEVETRGDGETPAWKIWARGSQSRDGISSRDAADEPQARGGRRRGLRRHHSGL